MQIRANGSDDQVMRVSGTTQTRDRERVAHNSGKENRNSIYAGDLGLGKDTITLRKQQAQKKALKLIQDAWTGDRKVAQNITDIKAKADELQADIEANQEIINQGELQKEALREQYGVEEDSQEQKDLELLEKEADMRRLGTGPDGVQLTEEEQNRLKELKDPITGEYKVPLTEYQKRCLEIDSRQSVYEKRITAAQQQIEEGYASIRSIRIEQLKHHTMVDAQQNADEIMEQAGKDAIGMLVDEAKDHVDETYEEQREKAKEKAEEKEEQEEKIEARREQEKKAREDSELMENMAEAGMDVAGSAAEVQTEVKDMLRKMKLLDEDLKGAAVDEEL